MPLDHSDVTKFAFSLSEVPKEARRLVRPAIRAEGLALKADMGARASWSSRIPGAIQIATSFRSGAKQGLTIRVDANAAPHARPYEGMSRGGAAAFFRHPVFGDREVWVSQATRPFFFPAVQAARPKFRNVIDEAIIRSLPRR